MPDKLVMQSPFQKAAIECTASWLQLEGHLKLMEAATMEGRWKDAEDIREQCSMFLQMHMDAKQASINLVHDSVRPKRG